MNISENLYFTRILKILKIFGFADYAIIQKCVQPQYGMLWYV